MKKNIYQIIILFTCSLILTFVFFNQVPKNLSYDEVEFAKLALSLDKLPFQIYSPLATGHATLYFYILLASFKIFGVNNFALRFPSAIFAVITPLVLYAILKKIFNPPSRNPIKNVSPLMNSEMFSLRTDFNSGRSVRKDFLDVSLGSFNKNTSMPMILSLIFLSTRWYINFSRFSFEVGFLLFLELMSIYFILKKDKISVLVSGLFAGLAFNSYLPGRIFFILPILYLIKKNHKKEIVYFLITFFIAALPLLGYFMNHKDLRITELSFIGRDDLSLMNKINYIYQNIKANLLMFFSRGDMNGRHNYPGKTALNPILVVLLLLGLTSSIKKIRQPDIFLFLSFLIIAFIPALLTNPKENPNMLRTFTALPALIFFIGQGMLFINALYKKKLLFFILLILLISSGYEIYGYFYHQRKVVDFSFEMRCDLQTALKKPEDCLYENYLKRSLIK